MDGRSSAVSGPARRRTGPYEPQGDGGQRERERVDGEGGADADDRDGDPGDRRADRPDQLGGPLHQGVGGRQPVGRDQPWDERVDGRQEDGIDRPEHDPRHGQVPDLDLRAEHQPGDDRGHDGAQDVRRESEVPRRDPVGQDAAEEHEDPARDRRRDEDHAEGEARAGQPEDEPRQRDQVELVAEERDALAEPDQPEVADDQRRDERQAGGPAEWPGDDRGRVHSSEIRTPSPPSSTSTIGPLTPGRDRLADPVRGRLGDARDLVDRRPPERQRDAQVDDRPTGLEAPGSRSAPGGSGGWPSLVRLGGGVEPGVGRRSSASRIGPASAAVRRPSATRRSTWSSAVGIRHRSASASRGIAGGASVRVDRVAIVERLEPPAGLGDVDLAPLERPQDAQSGIVVGQRDRPVRRGAARRRYPTCGRRATGGPAPGGSAGSGGDGRCRRAVRSARAGGDTGDGRTTRRSPDIERNVSSGPVVPTDERAAATATLDRSHRPPSAGRPTSSSSRS